MNAVDVVVVGGGVVGTSAAYHLAAAGAGSVLLLEREDSLGTGSTGRCAGGFRHQFSSEVSQIPEDRGLIRARIRLAVGGPWT